jgi:hypothetical protein
MGLLGAFLGMFKIDFPEMYLKKDSYIAWRTFKVVYQKYLYPLQGIQQDQRFNLRCMQENQGY